MFSLPPLFPFFIVGIDAMLCLCKAKILLSSRYFSILYILLALVMFFFTSFILMLITSALSYCHTPHFRFCDLSIVLSAPRFTYFTCAQTHFSLILIIQATFSPNPTFSFHSFIFLCFFTTEEIVWCGINVPLVTFTELWTHI